MIYNSEEKIGVYSVAKIFTEELKWIFREQPINDFGIDGFVEITSNCFKLKDLVPTGKLLGVQIKSGKSFFKEGKAFSYVFRGSKRHLQYWLNYSIAVILVIYDKETNLAYWQEVNKSTITTTEKSFKINIPKCNLLKNESGEQLKMIAHFKDKYQYKLNQLLMSNDEIKLLVKQPLFLYIEIDDIPNSSYYHITLLVCDENCDNSLEIIYRYDDINPNRFEYMFYLLEGNSLKEAITDTIPWADLFLDDIDFTDNLLTKYIISETLDSNNLEFEQDIVELKDRNAFLKLACYSSGLYGFKLEVKANKLASAFLALEAFFNKEPSVKQRIYL